MEDTLASQLTALANNLRKKYNKTTSLTIADMVRLTTPPRIADGTSLAIAAAGEGIKYSSNGSTEYDLRLSNPFPDLYGESIRLEVHFSNSGYNVWTTTDPYIEMITDNRSHTIISDLVPVTGRFANFPFTAVFHIKDNSFKDTVKFHLRPKSGTDGFDISTGTVDSIKIYNE